MELLLAAPLVGVVFYFLGWRYVLAGVGCLVAALILWPLLRPPNQKDICVQQAENSLRATREDWREMAIVVCQASENYSRNRYLD
ncbi:hypothetical protein [Roseomonas sp. USHLN139]|uniref:hypothetical protein n=1 Tax=Roseomonas sp. USHLN139 TaxID=3081298 RepID=UPI003B01C7A9